MLSNALPALIDLMSKQTFYRLRGVGGQADFYCNDPSSNPTEANIFSAKFLGISAERFCRICPT